MVSDRAFKFHICIPWGKALSLVPSEGHLQVQGQISKSQFSRKWPLRALVFHKGILFKSNFLWVHRYLLTSNQTIYGITDLEQQPQKTM